MIRSTRITPRFTTFISRPTIRLISPTISRRAAHQSYGNKESGHEGSDEPHPTSDQYEHPGPESPASGSGKSTNTESGKQTSTSSGSSGGRSAIHQPPEPDEHANEDVRRHNEELRQRYDQAAEKSGDTEKVDKKFWKENTGQN